MLNNGPRQLGVAVLGAGMIGRAHATGYITQAHMADGISVRLATAIDANADAAEDMARRLGFARWGTDWREVLDDPGVDVVSVALPNALHFDVSRGLLAAGKHVLCEKPLAVGAADAWQLVRAAEAADVVAATVFNYRRSAAIAAVRQLLHAGELGRPVQYLGTYLADYASDPTLPWSWRYDKAQSGGGAIVDVGVHAIDTARYLLGEIARIDGAALANSIAERPVALGHTVGHAHVEASGETRSVDNDDVATFTLTFANGCVGQIAASRVAVGFKNALMFTVIGDAGAAMFDYQRNAEFQLALRSDEAFVSGFRRIVTGPAHPFLADGLVVAADGVGHGYAETFKFQVHDFLKAVASGNEIEFGTFRDGYEANVAIEAVLESAATKRPVTTESVRRRVEATQA